MNQSNKNNSIEENLKDTKHNKKANTVFLKLLAKQKSKIKANPWGVIRSETLPIDDDIKPRVRDK